MESLSMIKIWKQSKWPSGLNSKWICFCIISPTYLSPMKGKHIHSTSDLRRGHVNCCKWKGKEIDMCQQSFMRHVILLYFSLFYESKISEIGPVLSAWNMEATENRIKVKKYEIVIMIENWYIKCLSCSQEYIR